VAAPSAPVAPVRALHPVIAKWRDKAREHLALCGPTGVELRIVDTRTRVAHFDTEADCVRALDRNTVHWRELPPARRYTTNHEAEAAGLDGMHFVAQ
jgi:hypothetical protein